MVINDEKSGKHDASINFFWYLVIKKLLSLGESKSSDVLKYCFSKLSYEVRSPVSGIEFTSTANSFRLTRLCFMTNESEPTVKKEMIVEAIV
jgi:hypothetical protein